MRGTRRLTLSANRYFPEHEIFSSRPYTHISVELEIDMNRQAVDITYRKEKDELSSISKSSSYLYFETNEEILLRLLRFFSGDKPEREGEDEFIDISAKNGVLRTRRSEIGADEYQITNLRFNASWNRIVIETFEGGNPVIPYYEVEQGSEPEDRNNLEKLQRFSKGILESDDTKYAELELQPVADEIKRQLRREEWGDEVLRHIEEGDKCLQNGLLHPALNSYIHAIEWTIITYLKAEEDIDIIEREKNGNPYYFAGRNPNLIDELTNYVDISQKTKSRMESINSAERRWSAHHKSGEATQEEIKGVRSRLSVLLTRLFDSK